MSIKKYNIPEITLKYKRSKNTHTYTLKSSSATYELLKEIYDADTLDYLESSITLYLNRANKCIGWHRLSQGGISGTVIDHRILFATALKCGASAIIISHNHPSGNLMPSTIDDKLTQRIKEAGTLLEIALLDHIIVTSDGYYSYSDEGKL